MSMTLSGIQLIENEDSKHYFPSLKGEELDVEVLYLAVALSGEVGEVCNNIKKWYRDGWSMNEIRNELAKELPDILIYLVMLAGSLDIDLESAYEAKKEYNNGRFRGTTTKTE